MGRMQRQRFTQVSFRICGGLPGKCVHQVEIEIGEPGRVQLLGCPARLVRRVDAPEGSELARIETLRAKGYARDSRAAVFGESTALDSARIRLERDLDVRPESQEPARMLQEFRQCRGRKQAGRASAEK